MCIVAETVAGRDYGGDPGDLGRPPRRAALLACPSELIEISDHEGTLIAKELGLT